MKTLLNIVLVFATSISLVSCFNKERPNYQFFPDMYESSSYESYGAYDIFPNQQSAMLPVENTIPRGFEPYEFEDSNDGLLESKKVVDYPFEVTEENIATGKHLYTLYCAVCHGDKGDGQGILVKREKFLGIPSFADEGRTIVPGGIYHVETYGLNAMGSYASQTSAKERWQIAMHVMDLKASLKGNPGVLETAKKAAKSDFTENNNTESTGANTTGEIQSK
ncbi:MAG TPA: cytochrome c [Aequorivita sp.]|nr:cytochrome c [Aequorivita sp.]